VRAQEQVLDQQVCLLEQVSAQEQVWAQEQVLDQQVCLLVQVSDQQVCPLEQVCLLEQVWAQPQTRVPSAFSFLQQKQSLSS
jgi:hypothetical protein